MLGIVAAPPRIPFLATNDLTSDRNNLLAAPKTRTFLTVKSADLLQIQTHKRNTFGPDKLGYSSRKQKW